jgi:predicted MFS family arabinose efflux permease
METLANAGKKTPRRRAGMMGLAWIGGALATIAAVGIGAVLAIFFAATMVVIGLLTAVVLALGGVALRARKAARDDTLIEARHIGGHSWVAYGWDQRGR